MYPDAYAETIDLRERRYLVATLLFDAWLPRALVADLGEAENKAIYWSDIYGAPRTRISEVWVEAKHPRPDPPPARPAFAQAPVLQVEMAPRRERRKRRWADAFAKLDRPFDPSYAKALVDGFLLYVGAQVAFRALDLLRYGPPVV
jgi:hypothetical protein